MVEKTARQFPGDREWTILAILLVIFVAGLKLYLTWTSPMRRMLCWIDDDGFYYFKIARNIAAGYGSTFDRLCLTNGYHPLWCFLSALVYKIVPGLYSGVRANLTLGIALWSVSALLLWSGMKRKNVAWAFIALLLFIGYTFRMLTYMSGMETGLLETGIIVLLYAGLRYKLFGEDAKLASWLCLGVILTVIVLSRLDSVFMLPPVALALLAVNRKVGLRQLFHRFLITFGIPTFVLVVYMLINKHYFGTFMPLSGMLKSSFPHPAFHVEYLCQFAWSMPAVLVAFVSLAAVITPIGRKLRERGASANDLAILFSLSTYVLLHLSYILIFQRWAVFNWYFEPYLLIAIINVALLGAFVFRSTETSSKQYKLMYKVAIPLLLIAMVSFVGHRMQLSIADRTWQPWMCFSYDAGSWARQHSDPNDVFAMKDCGAFGYFSDRRVINLDGLVNCLQYQQCGNEGRANDYLRKVQVKYFVLHALSRKEEDDYQGEGQTTVEVPCKLYNKPGGRVAIIQNTQIFQSDPYPYEGPTRVRIWRYRPL